MLDKMKSSQTELGSKLFWRNYSRRLYEQAIEASYLENDNAEAFYFFEKSRAAVLQDQLNQLEKISSKDALVLAQLKKKILLLKRERDTVDALSKRYTEIQTELFTNNGSLDQLEQTIKQKNPLYYQSFLDTSMITIQDVNKNLLSDHQALLELFEGDSAVYSLLITAGKIYFNKIDKADFDTTTKTYVNYISDLSLLNSRFGEYTKTANHLYKLIFGENNIPAGRIIVSPAGHYFPFESLVTSVSSAPEYFLNNHAVSYTYSARYLMNDFASKYFQLARDFFGSSTRSICSCFFCWRFTGKRSFVK